jgi:hypothetical protein
MNMDEKNEIKVQIIYLFLLGWLSFAIISIALPIFSLRKGHIFFIVKSQAEGMTPPLTRSFTSKKVWVVTKSHGCPSTDIRFKLATWKVTWCSGQKAITENSKLLKCAPSNQDALSTRAHENSRLTQKSTPKRL